MTYMHKDITGSQRSAFGVFVGGGWIASFGTPHEANCYAATCSGTVLRVGAGPFMPRNVLAA